MSRGGLPALAELEIADDPVVWARIGFDVQPSGTLLLGGVTLRLAGRGAGEGFRSWTLRSTDELPSEIDGITTKSVAAGGRAGALGGDEYWPAAAHPNGATALDHVVVSTPHVARTLRALEAAGMEVRRVRDAGTPQRPLRQAFLWAGDVLVEVAGPPAREGDGPARLWGLVVVTDSLDLLAGVAGEHVGESRPAVQPGREIATLRRDAGSSVPMAFMTPHARPSDDVS